MDLKRAREIIKARDVDYDYNSITVLEGMNMIDKYDPGSGFSAEHEVIWFGDFEKTVKLMAEEEFMILVKAGWMEEYESWMHFV